AVPDDRSPKTRWPVDPGSGSITASSGHHSFRCSGLVMTSNTVAGEASISTSRSIVPYSIGPPSRATFRCTRACPMIGRYATFICVFGDRAGGSSLHHGGQPLERAAHRLAVASGAIVHAGHLLAELEDRLGPEVFAPLGHPAPRLGGLDAV